MFAKISPTRFSRLDMRYIRKKVLREKKPRTMEEKILEAAKAAKKQDYQNKEFTKEQLQEATELVIRKIFRTYFGRDFKTERLEYKDPETGNFGRAVRYEAASNTMCVSVFVCGGNLLYIATVYTINYEKEVKVCYYDGRHMMRNDDTYLRRVLADFSMLLNECKCLKWMFEDSPDRPPRGVYMDNGSKFYGVHEDWILTPMHYYAAEDAEHNVEIDAETGMTIYKKPTGEPKALPFDKWFEEIFDNIYKADDR